MHFSQVHTRTQCDSFFFSNSCEKPHEVVICRYLGECSCRSSSRTLVGPSDERGKHKRKELESNFMCTRESRSLQTDISSQLDENIYSAPKCSPNVSRLRF